MKKTAIAFTNSECTGVRWLDRNVFLYNLGLFGPDVKLRITVEHYHPQRSLKQNAVLHWYCQELAEECGMEAEDFKMMMKMKFITRPALDKTGNWIIDPSTGEVMTYIPSTSDLDTKEMTELIEKIRMFGLDVLNYELPLPDENYKIHFLHDHKKQLTESSKTKS